MPEWYANPDPRYQPAMRIVTNITQSTPLVVTTSFDHDYVTGLIVRLSVPRNYGMFQVDGLVGPITVLGHNSFSMDTDTTAYDSFLAPTSPPCYRKTAIVIPVGNIDIDNAGYDTLAVRNVS